MDNTGWVFVLTASGFVVFVLWLALSRYGKIPLGRDDEEPEFRTVSWVAMMFSAGMGIGLMFYGVSEPLAHFVTPAARHRPGRHRRGDADRDGHHALPLDAAPVGDLRGRRARHRLRHLPQGPQAADQRRLRAAARQAARQRRRAARSSTSWRSSPPSSARRPPSGSARCRSAAGCTDRRLASASVGNRLLVVIIAVLTVAFVLLRRLRRRARASNGCPTSTWCWRCCSPLFVFVVGPTILILDLLPTSIGCYFRRPAAMCRRAPSAERRRRRRRVARQLDGLLLGLVDLLDAVRRHVHRPDLPRPHDPSVRHRRAAGSEPGVAGLVRVFGGAAINVQQDGVDLAGEGSIEEQLFACSSSTRSRSSPACWSWSWSPSSSCPAPTPPRS